MTTGNDFGLAVAEQTLFSALLTPQQALSRNGFRALMGCLCAVSGAVGIGFSLVGAWPVFGFLGLDVLAIYLAFRIYFSRARASEEIRVTASELRLRRISHRGHVVEWVQNPLWVRLEQIAHAEFGIERLYLVSRGRRVAIAGFLGADEKAGFARALSAALEAARRGPLR
jgi:uncharacterized membrane protein